MFSRQERKTVRVEVWVGESLLSVTRFMGHGAAFQVYFEESISKFLP